MLNQGMFTPAPATGAAAIALGRAAGGGTTYYTIPGLGIDAAGTGGSTADTDQYMPWITPTSIVIDQLACGVAVVNSGTIARIGFYAADTDWQPIGAPLADSGNLDTSTTGTKTYTPGTPITVPAGRYLSVLNSDTGTTTFNIGRGPLGGYSTTLGTGALSRLEVARTYAAFPTPGTAWTTVVTGNGPINHAVFYRVLTP